MVPSRRRFIKVSGILLLVVLVCMSSCVSSLSSPSSSSSSSSSLPSSPSFLRIGNNHKSRTTFRFAPNGVCIEPQYFVETIPQPPSPGNNNNGDATDTRQQHQQGQRRFFTMRNVPGDGDCMFLAVALAAATSMGLGGSDALLRAISRQTRHIVAQVLGDSPPGTNLHISGKRLVSTSDLLKSACLQENMDKDQYLKLLRKEGREGGLYGGGPELTVLANVLRRPISIYELEEEKEEDLENGKDEKVNDDTINGNNTNNNEKNSDLSRCNIVCKGSFGEGLFEDPCLEMPNSAVLSGIQPGAYSWKLHILVLDIGNEKHACVLLPETPVPTTTTTARSPPRPAVNGEK